MMGQIWIYKEGGKGISKDLERVKFFLEKKFSAWEESNLHGPRIYTQKRALDRTWDRAREESGVGVKADLKGNGEPLIFLSKGVTE